MLAITLLIEIQPWPVPSGGQTLWRLMHMAAAQASLEIELQELLWRISMSIYWSQLILIVSARNIARPDTER